MYNNRKEHYFYIFILSFSLLAVGGGPWSSDLFGSIFEIGTKNKILITVAIVSFISLILYIAEKNRLDRSLTKLGSYVYSDVALNKMNESNITPEEIEQIIHEGNQSKSSRSMKYSRVNAEGKKFLVIIKNNVIVDIAC